MTNHTSARARSGVTRSLRIEGEFLPDGLGDLIDLRERIVTVISEGLVDDVGPKMANAVANGIVGWVVAKAAGEHDTLSAPTRSRYRRVLEVVAASGPGGGGRRRGAGLAATIRGVDELLALEPAEAALAGAPRAMSPIIYDERPVAVMSSRRGQPEVDLERAA